MRRKRSAISALHRAPASQAMRDALAKVGLFILALIVAGALERAAVHDRLAQAVEPLAPVPDQH
jgi:hypothetical protein